MQEVYRTAEKYGFRDLIRDKEYFYEEWYSTMDYCADWHYKFKLKDGKVVVESWYDTPLSQIYDKDPDQIFDTFEQAIRECEGHMDLLKSYVYVYEDKEEEREKIRRIIDVPDMVEYILPFVGKFDPKDYWW